jgi:hypothetical protein
MPALPFFFKNQRVDEQTLCGLAATHAGIFKKGAAHPPDLEDVPPQLRG